MDLDEIIAPISTIDLGNDGEIKFFEDEPGDLVVAINVKSLDLLNAINNLTPLEIYDYFDKESPEILMTAYLRSQEKDSYNDIENYYEEESFSQKDINIYNSPEDLRKIWTYNQFINFVQNDYKPYSEYKYQFEWERCSGHNYVQRYVNFCHTYAYSYRGTVTHRLRRIKWGKWKTLGPQEISKGEWSHIWNYRYAERTHKGEVYNSDGDGFHFVYYGDDF